MVTTYPVDVEEFVSNELTSGRFRSRDELFVEAVRVSRELKAQQHQLTSEIAESLEQADRGETTVFDLQEFIREQRSRLGLNRSQV